MSIQPVIISVIAATEAGCTSAAGPSHVPELEFGRCRFCEMQGKHENMMSEQVLRGDENYLNMLLECFNVFLATNGKRSLICASCARRLRDASDFKRLVMRAQSGLRDAAKRPASLPSTGVIIKLGPSNNPEINPTTETDVANPEINPTTETDVAKIKPTLLPAAQCPKSSLRPLTTTDTVSKIESTLLPAAQCSKSSLSSPTTNDTVSAKIKPTLLPAPQCSKSSLIPLVTATDTVSAKIKPTLLPAPQCSKSSLSSLTTNDTVSAKIKPTLLPKAQCSKSSPIPLVAATDTVLDKIESTLLPAAQCSKSGLIRLVTASGTVLAKIKPTLLQAAECSKSSRTVLTATDMVVVKKEPGIDIATHEMTETDNPELGPATENVLAKIESTLLPVAQCSKSGLSPLTTNDTVSAKIKPTLLPAAQCSKLSFSPLTATETVLTKIESTLLPAAQCPKSGSATDMVLAKIEPTLLPAAQCSKSSPVPLVTATDTVLAKIKPTLLPAAQCSKSSPVPLVTATDTVLAKIKPTLLPAAQCSKSSPVPLVTATDTVLAKIKPTLLPAAQCSKSSPVPLVTATDTVLAKIKPTLLPAAQRSKSSLIRLVTASGTVLAKIKPTLLQAAECSKSSRTVLTATDMVVVKKEPGIDIATHEMTETATLQNEAETLEAPKPRNSTSEPVTVKIEPGIDIVEHEVTGPEPKKPRLEDPSLKMDTILANLLSNCPELPVKQEIHSYDNDQSPFLCITEKFREEYYKSPQYEEEDKSVYEMPEKDLIDLDQESVLLDTGCGCKLSCVDRFDRNDVLKSRIDCLEQDYYCYHNINHLNLMMLGAISATVRLENERAHCVFWFRGAPVCKKFFLFAHALSNTKYEKILRCFKVSGVESLTHGNKKPLMTKQQRADVTTFINNFAKQNALVLPGRSSNNTDLYILPSSMSRTSIYERYVKACRKNNTYPVIRPLWYQCWDSFCSNVTISPPSHPCITCQNYATDISEPQTENDKKKSLKNALDHLNDVEIQRDYYQNIISEITPQVMNMSLSKNEPCSFDGTMHYSFDYLQQIHLPHNPDQTGPQDFLDSYKVSLFGVAVEPLNKFVLYVIPENVPRGINLVISLLHSFFGNFALGENRVVCHASNQNKNNILIQYAAWRVLSGLHKSFQLSFLPSGHDDFAPDIYFGLIKSKFRKSYANSLIDICEIAENAVSSGIITVVLVASETGESYIRNYDWKELFKSVNTSTVPEIHTYHHFKTDCQTSGSVMCSKSAEEFTTQITLFDLFQSKMPNIIKPQLSFERQKYLYYNIRKFVTTEYQDVLCPLPNGVEDQENTDSNQTGSKADDQCPMIVIDPNVQDVQKVEEICAGDNRKASACSYCGDRGHKNEIGQGIYVCPKRQLDSGETVKKCEYCIPKDVDNSVLDPNLIEVYLENCEHSEKPSVNVYPLEILDPKEVKTSSGGKKRPACSYCGLPGHRNLVKHGIYFCKKRAKDREASMK